VLIVVLLSIICGAWIQQSTSTNIVDPVVRDRIRHEWAIEQKKHDEDTERIRREWSIELTKHNEATERMRRERRVELKRHQAAMERAKAEEREWWEKKQKREREEEQKWQEKKQRRELEEAERVEKEKWERQRMRLYWDDIQVEERCVAHGTRKYSARLANLLPGIDAIEACKATPFRIHDVTYNSPDYCESVSHVSFLNVRTLTRIAFIRNSLPILFVGIGWSRIRCAPPFGILSMIRLVDSASCLFYANIYHCIRVALHQVQGYVYVAELFGVPLELTSWTI
jgi:hypothetical protein